MNSFPKWAKNLIFLLIYILSGAALILIIDGLSTGTEELTPFNTAIENFILTIRTPGLTHFMINVTNAGSPFVLFIIATILVMVLILHDEIYDTFLFIFSMLLSVISFVVLKNAFQISRPDAVLVGIAGWSFPSGHATIATTFFLTFAHSFIDWTKHWWSRILLILLSIFGAFLVCFSRIYLGAHWALDILAGIALGLLSVSFTILLFNIFLEEETWRRLRNRRKRSHSSPQA
jgi:undecaprenyl-diphosphatase